MVSYKGPITKTRVNLPIQSLTWTTRRHLGVQKATGVIFGAKRESLRIQPLGEEATQRRSAGCLAHGTEETRILIEAAQNSFLVSPFQQVKFQKQLVLSSFLLLVIGCYLFTRFLFSTTLVASTTVLASQCHGSSPLPLDLLLFTFLPILSWFQLLSFTFIQNTYKTQA